MDAFFDFIDDSPLVIHNARFDIGFINAELDRIDRPGLEISRSIDTVELARRKQPGAPANLDALCRRFGIDNSGRKNHGALLDAELLSEVYLELMGGRQPVLGLKRNEHQIMPPRRMELDARRPRAHEPNTEELDEHAVFIDSLNNPIWRR